MTTEIYQRYGKRPLDFIVSAVLLAALLPVFASIAIAVRLDSPGPVLFRQGRIGRAMRSFSIVKFRTMIGQPGPNDLPLTVAGDPRITRLGRLLRKSKLDELPQLWNILRGEMSLVGPHPEVGVHVTPGYTPANAGIVFRVRPGLTDPTALALMMEEHLLAAHPDPQAYYLKKLLPAKIAACRRYAGNVTLLGDLKIIAATLAALFAFLLGRGKSRAASRKVRQQPLLYNRCRAESELGSRK